MKAHRRPSVAALVVAAGALVCLSSLGTPLASNAHAVQYVSVCALAALASIIAVRANRPPSARPWLWLAAGQVCSALAEALWFSDPSPAFPATADIAFMAVYPCLIVGSVLLIRSRLPGKDWPALIDTAIVLLAAGTAAATLLATPLGAYPALDAALLALAARLAFGPGGRQNPSLQLLAGGFLFFALPDLWDAAARQENAGGHLQNVMWMGGYLLIAAAATHPSMARAGDEQAAVEHGQRQRLVGLGLMAALPALTLVIKPDRDGRFDQIAAGLGMLAIVGLVMTRLGLLLATVRSLSKRESERQFLALVEHSTDVVAIFGADGRLRYVSPSIEGMLGCSPDGLDHRGIGRLVHPEDRPVVDQAFGQARARAGAEPVLIELRMRHADGEWRQVEAAVANLLDQPDLRGIVVTARDITDRKQLESRLIHQAFHDPLTGLANRALLLEQLGEALLARAPARDASRENLAPEHPVAVLFIDLDDFKTINDVLGHALGDRLLVELAQRLQACVRPGEVAARFGGDEFAVLLAGPHEPSRPTELAEELLRDLGAAVQIGDSPVSVTASVGIVYAEPASTAEILLRNADMAMYAAKARGKARFEVFEPGMHRRAVNRLDVKARLARAIGAGELELVYQPIVELETYASVGVEALVRWNDPTLGLIRPAEFIPIAEETGLIIDLGRWVVETACAQGVSWQTAAGDAPFVSVNLSAVQLRDRAIVEHVAAALFNSSLDPDRLVLELTESAVINDLNLAAATFRRLKKLGVGLAIDDFGAGFSSLSYLQRLPLDVVKIDRSLISPLGRSRPGVALAADVVPLVRNRGVKVVAEGIERPAQVQALIELGCPWGQGFLLSTAVPGEQVPALLAAPLTIRGRRRKRAGAGAGVGAAAVR
ncbi:MAG: putative bifunctional diguanylate cyclase/phosphodiesterase [Acidimicrobiales bacterium]